MAIAFGYSYLLLFRITSLDIDVIGTPRYCSLVHEHRAYSLVRFGRPRLGTG